MTTRAASRDAVGLAGGIAIRVTRPRRRRPIRAGGEGGGQLAANPVRLRTGEDRGEFGVEHAAGGQPAGEHTRPHRAVRGDRGHPVTAAPAQLLRAGPLVAGAAPDLPEPVVADLGHAQLGELGLRGLGTLPPAEVDYPGA